MAAPGASNGRAETSQGNPLWPRQPASSFASNDSVYPDDEVRPPPRRDPGRRGVKTGAVLTLLGAIVLLGGAALMHWHADNEAREQQVKSIDAQGIVISNEMRQHDQAPATPQAAPVARGADATTPSDKESADKRNKSMVLALARAHEGLANNDLHTARSGIYWALSLQPDNPQALLLKQDLLSRERARNSALKAARSCVVQERGQCAWQNANTALSIDSSSTEAKGLLARSIVDSSKAVKPNGAMPQ